MVARKDITPVDISTEQVALDNRQLLQRLRFLVRFSQQLNFYDSKNQINGDWSPFLLKDPLIFSAWLSEAQYQQPCSEFLGVAYRLGNQLQASDQLSDLADETTLIMLRQLARQVAKLFVDLHRWFSLMNVHHQSQQSTQDFLATLRSDIAPQLSVFISLQDYLITQPPRRDLLCQSDLVMIHDCWSNAGNYQVNSMHASEAEKQQCFYSPSQCLAVLESMHKIVFGFYIRTAKRAGQDYQRLLSGFNGYPDTSLLIAYTARLDDYSGQLNNFTDKHLDFYYQKILQGSPAQELADETFLSVELAANHDLLTLPAGTQFKAGVYDNQTPILFANNKEETLNSATITSATNLCNLAGEDGKHRLIKQDLSAYVAKAGKKSLQANEHSSGFKIFGDGQGEIVHPALIISSPMLCLSSGQRKIVLSLALSKPCQLTDFSDSEIFISTATGWQKVIKESWSQQDENGLQLELLFDAQFPAISRYAKDSQLTEARWPMLKIVTGEKVDLKQTYNIESVAFDLEVENAHATFSSDLGKLKANQLTFPFTANPEAGNNFNIHLPELYVKPLTSLTLSLSWNKLPNDFAEYYASYNQYLEGEEFTFNNDSFRISGYQLKQGQWQGIQLAPNTLFLSDENSTKINKPISTFLLANGENLYCLPSVWNEDALYKNQQQPLFRITLDSPQQGFGHSLYSSVIASWSMSMARGFEQPPAVDKKSSPPVVASQAQATPALPWVPQTKAITLNYRSACWLDLSKDSNEIPLQIFHQDSFSCYAVYDSQQKIDQLQTNFSSQQSTHSEASHNTPALLPSFSPSSALFLSFTKVNLTSPINLLFQMSCWAQLSEIPAQALNFYYLSQSGWRSLTPLKDDTEKLTVSGIITLQLAKDATDHSPLMNQQDFYIAITEQNVCPARARPVLIDTQAIRVQRVLPTALKEGETPSLAAFTIKAPQAKLSGLKAVSQPSASFAGRAREDQQTFRQRISQRIRHKNRAVTAYDYECLALSYLPQAYFARCINNNDDPAEILLAVIASHKEPAAVKPPQVAANNLSYAQQQLVERSPAFSRIRLFNMKQQPLRIKAEVRFIQGQGSPRQCAQISQTIRLFMSPWSEQQAEVMDLDKGLQRADIIKLISAHSAVSEVISLDLASGSEQANLGQWQYKTNSNSTLWPCDQQHVFIADLVDIVASLAQQASSTELA